MLGMLSSRAVRLCLTGASACVLLAGVLSAHAQDSRHGRKYKAPPETAHLEVLVVKAQNGKVVENAAVIFHPTKDGSDEGNLEIKSGPDGRAFIDLIPKGSQVGIQVIAPGFETWAGNVNLKDSSDSITARLVRPRAQISTYENEQGKPEDIPAGIQVQDKVEKAPPARTLAPGDPVIRLTPAVPANKETPTRPADDKSQPPAGDQTSGSAPQR